MKNKSFIGRLLDNKKIVLLLSFLLAVSFWVISSDNTADTIYNVPLKYSFSEDAPSDLKVFGLKVDEVSVDVVGKRVVIEDLEGSDLTAIIDLSSVKDYTEATFPIQVRNNNSDFEVEDIEPNSVRLLIDREVRKTVKLITDFPTTNDKYFDMSEVPETIEISGPQSVVSKVKIAYIGGDLSDTTQTRVTNSYSVKLFDSTTPNNRTEISKEYIELSHDTIDVTFRFLEVKNDVPLSLAFNEEKTLSIPSQWVRFDPTHLNIAGPKEYISGIKAISNIEFHIGSLAKYDYGIHEIEMSIEEILDKNLVCNDKDISSVKATVDFKSHCTSKVFVVSSSLFDVIGTDSASDYQLPETVRVKIIGETDTVNNLTQKDIKITLDFSSVDKNVSGTVKVPVEYDIQSEGVCWVYDPDDTPLEIKVK